MIIFDKHYSSEELCDINRDVYEAFELDIPQIPQDEHGFHRGEFRVTIEWIDDGN